MSHDFLFQKPVLDGTWYKAEPIFFKVHYILVTAWSVLFSASCIVIWESDGYLIRAALGLAPAPVASSVLLLQ